MDYFKASMHVLRTQAYLNLHGRGIIRLHIDYGHYIHCMYLEFGLAAFGATDVMYINPKRHTVLLIVRCISREFHLGQGWLSDA